MIKFTSLTLSFILIFVSQSLASYIGPSPYTSFSDSPFAGGTFTYFHLEDFEDGLLNTPGVSVDHANLGSGFAIDSVDLDDGVLDGSGAAGKTFWHSSSMTFTFDPGILGVLPTHAGLVFTDGTPGGLISFEAFDASGTSLGVISANLGDGSFFGTTAEDRFFGIVYTGGISKILMHDNGSPNNLEVDHLQYGSVSAPVPEPSAYLLMMSALTGLIYFKRRK